MKREENQHLSVDALLQRFVEVGRSQDKALLRDEVGRFNRLFYKMQVIVEELKSREGDQRRALSMLYDHPNLQVRLAAATNSLALMPEEARRVIQTIAEPQRYPQAGDAGMPIWTLDEGIFKPE